MSSFLIFTPNPPTITTMPPSGKESQLKKIKTKLQNILKDYKECDLGHQEMRIFNFIEQNLEEMPSNDLYKIVKKFMDKIKDEMKENKVKPSHITFTKDKSQFNLNFGHIFSLVNMFIYIVEYNSTKGKTCDIIKDFIDKGIIPTFKGDKASDQQFMKIISLLKNVKTLNICLYTNSKDNYYSNRKKDNQNNKNNSFYMDPKVVFFFGLFYKAFFKTVMTVNFDLNILPIDKYYSKNNNPYAINEEKVLNVGKEYKDIIICNLIMVKALQKYKFLSSLNIKMYDSYQLELHSTLTNIFGSNVIKEINPFEGHIRKLTMTKLTSVQMLKNLEFKKIGTFADKQRTVSAIADDGAFSSLNPRFNNNYLYFQHLLNLREDSFFDFSFDFNSLDPLLFSYINYVIYKFTCISNLNLILFPHKKFNKRKIALNNSCYNKFLKNEQQSFTYSSDDTKIYYQYLDNTVNEAQNNFILKDEKLLNELFIFFNKNLQNLSIILEKQINELLTLSIDFSTHNNDSISLYNYDSYNCSIICFIFDLFKTLQLKMTTCKIKSLDILYDDFLDEKSYIFDTIKKKFPSWRGGFQLNDLQVNHINFNISNISLILPFENFPSVNLTELIVSNLSYNDLNNFINAVKNKIDIFPVLMILDISLGIFVEDYREPLETLLKKCLPQKLSHFYLKLPFNISTNELIDILYWIKLSHRNDLKIFLKIIHEELSEHIKKDDFVYIFNECLENSNLYLKERNLIIKGKTNSENKIINVEISKYKDDELNNYFSIIHCLQKLNNKLSEGKNRKVFENIFNFKGNFKKFNVDVEVNE